MDGRNGESGNGQDDLDDDDDDDLDDDLLSVLRLIAERAGKVILAYYVEDEAIEPERRSSGALMEPSIN